MHEGNAASARLKRVVLCAAFCFALSATALAQAGPSAVARLTLDTDSLPAAAPHESYLYKFQAHGGTVPLHWEIVSGELPPGIKLESDGTLRGTTETAGTYHFTVAVADSGNPTQSVRREFVLPAPAPLMLKWTSYARVLGSRIQGSVAVSNDTKDDLDLTVIVQAVNEVGKAFAIGYQHLLLRQGIDDFDIPFGDTLPHGAYVVHVDAIGEARARKVIHRARLQTPGPLQVAVGP